ncbi:MAG: hypothetical protein ABJA80_14060 [bacterium]
MIERTRTLRPLALLCGAALLFAAPLHAQDALTASATRGPVPVAAEPAAAPVGPTLDAASVAVRRPAADVNTPAPAAARGHDRGTALMIVGGAAILTGLVVGSGAGYAISVAGAVVGLYGLYVYLQ